MFSRASRLKRAELKLADKCYDAIHWSFADRPSDTEYRENELTSLIHKVYKLGGDPMDIVDFRFLDLVLEALPDAYEKSGIGYELKTVPKLDIPSDL